LRVQKTNVALGRRINKWYYHTIKHNSFFINRVVLDGVRVSFVNTDNATGYKISE